jgi:polyhydroxyalkanoate synthesis regulator phasin
MTLAARRATIEHMMMSPHTHVALSHAREQELRERVRHAPTTTRREVTESTESVGRLRRRLAQMHLAALPQG